MLFQRVFRTNALLANAPRLLVFGTERSPKLEFIVIITGYIGWMERCFHECNPPPRDPSGKCVLSRKGEAGAIFNCACLPARNLPKNQKELKFPLDKAARSWSQRICSLLYIYYSIWNVDQQQTIIGIIFSCSLFAGFNVRFALGDKLMKKPSSKLAQSSGTRDCFIVFMIQ